MKKISDLKEESNTLIKMVSELDTEVKSLRNFTVESVVPETTRSCESRKSQNDGAMVLTPLLKELKLLNQNIVNVGLPGVRDNTKVSSMEDNRKKKLENDLGNASTHQDKILSNERTDQSKHPEQDDNLPDYGNPTRSHQE